MSTPTGFDLLTGPFPVSIEAAAGVAALYLLIRRGRRWWAVVGAAAAAAVLLALGAGWFLVQVAGITAHELPWPVTAWIGVAFLAVILAVLNMARTGWRRTVLAPVSMTVLI
ncbi:MAG TPA: esterase, partial [Arthrobacter sp.]